MTKAKRLGALVLSTALIAVVPAGAAEAGKKSGDSQKTGPNQCRNQKGIQVNALSCNNINSVDIL